MYVDEPPMDGNIPGFNISKIDICPFLALSEKLSTLSRRFLERYSPAEPIAMFHSERPHWSDWIQNMPLFKVGSVNYNWCFF